jgi:hypothetical protein
MKQTIYITFLTGWLFTLVYMCFIVYLSPIVFCKCPLCIVVGCYVLLLDDICVHGSSWLVHVVILYVLPSYLYVCCSHVYVLY